MLVDPDTGLVVFVEMSFDYGKLSVLFGLLPFLNDVGTVHKDFLGISLLVVIKY